MASTAPLADTRAAHTALTVSHVSAHLFRAPVSRAMRTSFGILTERSCLLVCLRDRDGAEGWGEAYCNFPPGAGEHRLGLIARLLEALIIGRHFDGPQALYSELEARTRVLALQTGELGPIQQCVAALDIAAWDLYARRSGMPLRRLLAATPRDVERVYISGLNPDQPEKLAEAEQARGHRAFKLKLGFGRAQDLRNLQAVREAVGEDASIAVDPNQAWDMEETITMARLMAPYRPEWLEEPLLADTSLVDWQRLAAECPLPLAVGENLRSAADFRAHIASGLFKVMQPDPIKWGGISGLIPVAKQVAKVGLRFCPHYLGSGIGFMATAQLAAAFGGADALLEMDQNENPLRDVLAPEGPTVTEGCIRLPNEPGLGVTPDLDGARRWLVAETST